MGGTRLVGGSGPRFSQLPIFSLWFFLPSSPGKAPPSALWSTAHQQDPAAELEGGAARASELPPRASHFRA